MSKFEIIKSWYPDEIISDEEVLEIYDRLLQFFFVLYQEDKAI